MTQTLGTTEIGSLSGTISIVGDALAAAT